MNPYEAAIVAVKTLSEKKGEDIRLLNTTELTVIADYFVICTATSAPHIKALTEEVDKRLSDAGMPAIHREGYRSSTWVLLDYGGLVVHVFLEETRQFYGLDRLWGDAQEIDIKEIEA